ncbi:unnamed protein product [Closterium sp. Naga37s-1]|nr:unnamed protein product [Closterium sp. Naga37s-1]
MHVRSPAAAPLPPRLAVPPEASSDQQGTRVVPAVRHPTAAIPQVQCSSLRPSSRHPPPPLQSPPASAPPVATRLRPSSRHPPPPLQSTPASAPPVATRLRPSSRQPPPPLQSPPASAPPVATRLHPSSRHPPPPLQTPPASAHRWRVEGAAATHERVPTLVQYTHLAASMHSPVELAPAVAACASHARASARLPQGTAPS